MDAMAPHSLAGRFLAATALSLGGLLAMTVLLPVLLLGAAGSDQPLASGTARADIPPGLVPVYQHAGQTCPGLPWTVLAAIGKVESDHGRSTLPGVASGTNSAGAAGPMQFLGRTWAAFARDGDGDGTRDVYDPEDAIYGAAAYLCANGAGNPGRLRDALWHYNHSTAYVDEVLRIADGYGGVSAVAPEATDAEGGDAAIPSGFVFPVLAPAGAVSFTDDYRSPRAAGGQCPDHPTWHCATDIFATRGTPVVAPITGRLTRVGYQALGGNRLWVEGRADRFYLAHLDSFAPEAMDGDQVAAGQVLGFVGNTGSAAGTPTHLHLAWEHLTAAGAWVNSDPYRLLQSAAPPSS